MGSDLFFSKKWAIREKGGRFYFFSNRVPEKVETSPFFPEEGKVIYEA